MEVPIVSRRRVVNYVDKTLEDVNVDDLFESQFASPDLVDLKKYLRENGQTDDIKQAYEKWLSKELADQLTAFPIPLIVNGKKVFLVFTELKIISPTYVKKGITRKLMPQYARLHKMNYSCCISAIPIFVNAEQNLEERGTRKDLFDILCMVGSKYCNLYDLNAEMRVTAGEEPADPGGYFIYNGTNSAIPGVDKMRINRVFIQTAFKRFMHNHASQTFNVPSGTAVIRMLNRKVKDRSIMTACHFSVSGMKINVTDSKKYKELNSINIFHFIDIICYMYGRNDLLEKKSSEEYHFIYDDILAFVCDEDPDVRDRNTDAIKKSLLGTVFEYERSGNFTESLSDLLNWTSVASSPNSVKSRKIFDLIEKNIFFSCNIRKVGDKYEGVEEGIQMLAYMAYRYLLFEAGLDEISSKDDWGNKKVDMPHIHLSQIFWTQWTRQCTSLMTAMAGDQTGSVDKFAKDLQTTIITTNLLAPFNSKSDVGTVGSAFEQSQKINATNVKETISIVTKIQTKTEKTVGSFGVRAVQASSFGYICPSQNPDGGKCGLVRRKAMTTSYTIGSDPSQFVELLNEYDMVRPRKSRTYNTALIVNEHIRLWCKGRDCYDKLMIMKKNVVWAYTFKQSRNVINLTPKWYPEELKIWLEELGKITDDENDGDYQVNILDEFFGYCNTSTRDKLIVYSKLPGRIANVDPKTCVIFSYRGHVEFFTDANRMTRPLYVCYSGRVPAKIYYTSDLSFSDMLARGLVAYVDTYEESSKEFLWATDYNSFLIHQEKKEDAKLQILNLSSVEYEDKKEEDERVRILQYYKDKLKGMENLPISYVGLHGVAIYGISASAAPMTGYETPAKAAHQAKIMPQALSGTHTPYSHKKGIFFPQGGTMSVTIPSISSMYGDRIQPTASSVVVAFIDNPYNQEDAIVISSRLVDTGKFIFARRLTISGDLNVEGATVILLGLHSKLDSAIQHSYRHLSDNGLPAIGSYLEEGDVAIGLVELSNATDPDGTVKIIEKNRSVALQVGERGRVIDIILRPKSSKDTRGDRTSNYTIDVLLEEIRVPEVGDKFAFMYGQKAVIGKIENIENMPFCTDGNAFPQAEVLINSHAIKNRMTLGELFEMLIGSAAAARGIAEDVTSFLQKDFSKFEQILLEAGFSRKGTYKFISGETGEMLRGLAYTGPLYMQQLLHIASASIHAGAGASKDIHTKQTKRASRGGGQKMGEMERDILIAHGAYHLFEEKFRIFADNYVTSWCTACNIPSNRSIGKCEYCDATDQFKKVKMPFVFKRSGDYCMAMGIRLYCSIVSEEEYAERYVEEMTKKLTEDNKYLNALNKA